MYSAMLNKKCECKRYIKYSSKKREATDDTRVYLFEDGTYKLFKVVEVGDDDIISALQIKTLPRPARPVRPRSSPNIQPRPQHTDAHIYTPHGVNSASKLAYLWPSHEDG